MDLEFTIINQTITRTDTLIPRADSIGYLYAHFTFSSDWEDIAQKMAIFSNDTVAHKVLLDINNKCAVPSSLLVSGKFQVSIFAEDITPKRYTANEATVWVWESGYTPDTDEEAEEAVSVYAQMLAKYEEILAIVEAIPPIPNGVMKKVISYTVPAGASTAALVWTEDDAGSLLTLAEIDVSIFIPSNSLPAGSTAEIRVRVNDLSGASDYTRGNSFLSYMSPITFSMTKGRCLFHLKKNGDAFYGVYWYTRIDGVTILNSTGVHSVESLQTSINKLYFYLNGLTYFPEGTVIEIYGRTA